MQPTNCDPNADDLVNRARTEREAFGELYDMIYPPVFRYCLRRSGNRSLAEDITSMVFLNVAGSMANFAGATFEEFRRWVFMIATNEINADCRKTTRRTALLAEPDELLNEEQKSFDELQSASQFDDSLCETHQDELRQPFMEMFDRSQRPATVAVPIAKANRNASQMIGVVASVAACLLGFVSLFFAARDDSSNGAATEVLTSSGATIDPEVIAALDEVQALRERFPPELFFNALAICQVELEARQSDADANQMRCLYEILLRSLPVDSLKG